MAIDTSLNALGVSGQPGTPSTPDADRQQIKQLAQQFEAMLLTQMMREMRRSMIDDEEGGSEGFGSDALMDNANIEFGNTLSRNGGLGFSNQMLEIFERQIAALEGKNGPQAIAGQSVTAATGAPMRSLAVEPIALHRSAVPLALQPTVSGAGAAEGHAASGVVERAPVSSAFGWRRDPMTGASKFHAGVDIAVAYGRDVKSAADGVVAFAGTQNGYGQTVIIDHGEGRQTRYAHLSEPLVKAGDTVSEGQIVGKSGNSGRSTGPHLHFEMLVNGRAVDPLSGQI